MICRSIELRTGHPKPDPVDIGVDDRPTVPVPPIIEMVQWHKYQERDPAILWFIDLLRIVAAELSRKPPESE